MVISPNSPRRLQFTSLTLTNHTPSPSSPHPSKSEHLLPGLMAYPTPPSSHPLERSAKSRKTYSGMPQQLQTDSWSIRDALLDLSSKLHEASSDLAAVGSRAQASSLLQTVVEQGVYGECEPVDKFIVRILHLAVQTCAEEAATVNMVPRPPYLQDQHTRDRPRVGEQYEGECDEDEDDEDDDARVFWSSPTQIDAREHLELYRNIAAYLASHPASSLYRDPLLQETQQVLQRLCPRVNGLSRWTWTELPVSPAPTLTRSEKGSGRPRGGEKRGKPKPSSRASPRSKKTRDSPLQLLTPPSQSGDVSYDGLDDELVPTLPVSHPGRWRPRRDQSVTPDQSSEEALVSTAAPAEAAQRRQAARQWTFESGDMVDVNHEFLRGERYAAGVVDSETVRDFGSTRRDHVGFYRR
jgi:hypothetical protein